MKKEIKEGFKVITIVICLVMVAIGIYILIDVTILNVDANEQIGNQLSDSEQLPDVVYPDSVSNDYVWSHSGNANYQGMGQYVINQNGQWYEFCGIQYNDFRLIGDTSLYWSEGSSYYGRGSYRFPPDIYRLEFNYNTNEVVIKGV